MLTREQFTKWNEAGVLGPFFSGIEASELASLRDFSYGNILEPNEHKYDKLINLHLKSKAIYEIAKLEPILNVVQDLIGPNILLWRSSLFTKLPGNISHEVKLHQDDYGWEMHPSSGVSIWFAVDDVFENSGPIEFLQGTHRECIEHVSESGTYFSFKAKSGAYDETASVFKAVCTGGNFFVFSSKILHRSDVNFSEHPRLGIAFRYCAPNVKVESPASAGLLLRGTDNYKLNVTFNAPTQN